MATRRWVSVQDVFDELEQEETDRLARTVWQDRSGRRADADRLATVPAGTVPQDLPTA